MRNKQWKKEWLVVSYDGCPDSLGWYEETIPVTIKQAYDYLRRTGKYYRLGSANKEPNPDWSPINNPDTGPNDYRIVTISEFQTMKKSNLAIVNT
jgi:hypothetical protein